VFLWQHHPGWTAVDLGFNGRAAENTLRLATLRALSRNAAEPAVGMDDVRWGWAITHASVTFVQEGARRHLSASPHEALRKAVTAALEAAPDATLPMSKLMERNGIRGADMRELVGALQWLITAGSVVDISGRPVVGRGSKFKLNPVLTV